MKKLNKNLLFTFGSLSTIAIPTIAIVSCGESKANNNQAGNQNNVPSRALRLEASSPEASVWNPIFNNTLKANDWISVKANDKTYGSQLTTEDIFALNNFKDTSVAGVAPAPNAVWERKDQVFNFLAAKIAKDNLIDIQEIKQAMGVKVNTTDPLFKFSNVDTGDAITINNVLEMDFNKATGDEAKVLLHTIEVLKNTPGVVFGVKFTPKALPGQTQVNWSDMAYVMKRMSEGFDAKQDNYVTTGAYTLLGEVWQHQFEYYDGLSSLRVLAA